MTRDSKLLSGTNLDGNDGNVSCAILLNVADSCCHRDLLCCPVLTMIKDIFFKTNKTRLTRIKHMHT